MYKTQCFLALIALSIGVVHSWDIAITTGNKVEFYTNKTKTINVGTQFKDLTALAYDAVHNMLLFVDKNNDNASIFSYHLATKNYQYLVRRRPNENIQGVAFDPVTSMLFWTDSTEKSISSMSLKPGSKNDPYGNLLIKMDDEIPRAIAVDSCRGYIYWTNVNTTKATIEKAKFDGSDRKVVVHTDLFMPVSIAVDQRTRKLYWADDKEGTKYTIESSDLDGNSRHTMLEGEQHKPNALTVSKDSLYWVDSGYDNIWGLPKNDKRERPEVFIKSPNEKTFGIVANYEIEEQTEGVSECDTLRSLSLNKSAINDSFSVPPEMGLFCVHGMKINGKLECMCSSGYTGERCDISVCQNFCFQGDCRVDDGHPTCRCRDGFKGERCEISVCHEYCLNNGFCSLDNEHKPVCKCSTDYKGSRCETEIIFTTSTSVPTAMTKVTTVSAIPEHCNCTQNATKYSSENVGPTDGEFVITTNDGWDSVRDPIIMVLGTLCGLLFLACFGLITRIMQLKKRPRIKKRIIVTKNVTPMTARPDQCEITIENCCNMNICETPCFEPRSTIRPTLLDGKSGKEEKKNLIANMEYPDEY